MADVRFRSEQVIGLRPNNFLGIYSTKWQRQQLGKDTSYPKAGIFATCILNVSSIITTAIEEICSLAVLSAKGNRPQRCNRNRRQQYQLHLDFLKDAQEYRIPDHDFPTSGPATLGPGIVCELRISV
ncbi:hypothetical protein NC652_024472 [Populus alba x Populus x berolinensis]|nr:hypothetical protein NC652_024472 [Populus alba x Populus x berolinensis]